MCSPTVSTALALIPNVRKLGHGLGLLLVQLRQELRIHLPAVPCHPARIDLKGVNDQLLMAGHYVHQVSQALRGVPVSPNVNMHRRAPRRVGLCARFAEAAAKLLKGVDVVVMQDGGHKLGFGSIRSGDGRIVLEPPLSPLLIPGRKGVIPVAVGRIFPAVGTEEFCRELCGGPAGDSVHFNFHPDGLVLDGLDLPHRLFVHCSVPLSVSLRRRRCVSFVLGTYYLKETQNRCSTDVFSA